MPVSPSENTSFLRNGDVVNVGIDLPDKTFVEDLATVITTDSGDILFTLCGSGFPKHLPINAGSRVVITRGEGRSLFHGTTTLKDSSVDSTFSIELPQRVIVRERHEYMRVDVMLPVHYYMPTSQVLGKVIAEWEELKKCNGNCRENIVPIAADRKSRVNLNGSGLRFKIRDCLSYGTLLHIKIDLPEDPQGHLHAIGSIVRTKELIPEMSHSEYYSTSMSFRMIDNSDRQRLLKHILNEQHKHINDRPSSYL